MNILSPLFSFRAFKANWALKTYLTNLQYGVKDASQPWEISKDEIHQVEKWIGQGATIHQTSLVTDDLILAPALCIELLRRDASLSSRCLEKIKHFLNHNTANLTREESPYNPHQYMGQLILWLLKNRPNLDWFNSSDDLFLQRIHDQFESPFDVEVKKVFEAQSLFVYLKNSSSDLKFKWLRFVLRLQLPEGHVGKLIDQLLPSWDEDQSEDHQTAMKKLLEYTCMHRNMMAFNALTQKGVPLDRDILTRVLNEYNLPGGDGSGTLYKMLKIVVEYLGSTFNWNDPWVHPYKGTSISFREKCENLLSSSGFNAILAGSQQSELNLLTDAVDQFGAVRRI